MFAARHAVLAAASVALVVAFMVVGSAGGAANGKRDVQAPSAPADISVLSVTPTMVDISWGASTDNVGVVGYYVYVDGDRTRVDGTRYWADKLQCGTSPSIMIEAFDRARNRSGRAEAIVATAACPDVQPPTSPTDFRQEATTQSAIVISWAPSEDDVGVVGYAVYRDGLQVGSTPQPTTTLEGLTCGSVYVVAADAVDAAGNRSELGSLWVQTADCIDGQPPSVPTGLVASGRTASTISLSWSSSSDNVGVTAYEVTAADAAVMTVTVPSATVENLTCGTSYKLGVSASDAAGNRSQETTISASTAACSSPPPPPPSEPGDTAAPTAVTGLVISSVTQATLTLAWNASTDNVGVTGYAVFRDDTKLATVTATSSNQTGLSCGTSYTLAVEAFDAAGNHSARAQLNAATVACSPSSSPPPPPPGDTTPPSPPAGLGLQAATLTSVTLTWAPSTDNVGVAGYGVYRGGTSVSSPVQPGATVSGLSCGAAYAFEVDAFDAAGNRSSRAAVTVSTAACPDTQSPTAPIILAATVRTATSIALSWSASSDNVGVTGYGLYKAGTPAGASSSTTGIFAGLMCDTNYTLAVDAYDVAGNRSPKTTVMVATAACPDSTPPSTPTGLAASNVTQTSLTLSWNASSDNVGVTGYDVYRNNTKLATVTSAASNQTGLTCGTSYVLAVEALDAAGNRSSRAQLNTASAACSPPPPPSSHGTLIFEDQFDSLNRDIWANGIWGYDVGNPSNEGGLYRPANSTVSSSILSLTAKREDATTSWPNYSGKVFPYTTGGICSDPDQAPTGFEFTYGYVEARIKIPEGRGLWPAFWLRTRDSTPGGGEIDIEEILGHEPARMHMNYHGAFNSGSSYLSPVSLASGWHTYAVDWRPGSVVWYLDGVERFRLTNSAITSTPHYLILQLAVGDTGSWPGPPDASTVFPAVMQYDYVKVWQ